MISGYYGQSGAMSEGCYVTEYKEKWVIAYD